MNDLPSNKSLELKPDIKLTKSDTEWKETDMIFRSESDTGDINDYNLMETVERMNYFAESYGIVKNKNDDKGLHDNYTDFSKHQLKKELRSLEKDRNSNVYIIKYISQLLRNATNRKNNNIIDTTDRDKKIKENFSNTNSFLEKDD